MYPKHYYPELTDVHFTSMNMVLIPYVPTDPPGHVSATPNTKATVLDVASIQNQCPSRSQEHCWLVVELGSDPIVEAVS